MTAFWPICCSSYLQDNYAEVKGMGGAQEGFVDQGTPLPTKNSEGIFSLVPPNAFMKEVLSFMKPNKE